MNYSNEICVIKCVGFAFYVCILYNIYDNGMFEHAKLSLICDEHVPFYPLFFNWPVEEMPTAHAPFSSCSESGRQTAGSTKKIEKQR